MVFSYSAAAQTPREYLKHYSVLDSLVTHKHFEEAITYTDTQTPSSELIRALFIHQKNRARLKQHNHPPEVEVECLESHRILRNREDSLSVYLDARTLELLGHYHYQRSNLFIGLSYLDSAARKYDQLEDYESSIYNLNMIGTIYDHNGEKAKSVRYYQRAIQMFKTHPIDSSYYFELLIDMGNLHLSLDQTDQAHNLYQKVYSDPSLYKYPDIMADVYTNMGNVAQRREQYAEAEYFYNQGIQAYRVIGDSSSMSFIYHDLGSLVQDSSYQQALVYYQKSLDIKRKQQDHSGMANTMYAMARVHYLNGNIRTSEDYAFRALNDATKGPQIEVLSKLYNLLATIYASQQEWEKAYDYSKQYREISDSLFLLEQQETIDKIQQIYHIEEQNQIITNLEKSESQKQDELKKSKVINYALGGATVLLIIVLILLMSNFQQMQRTKNTLYTRNLEITAAEALMKGQEEERQRLAHQLHDKVGNHITVLKNHVVTHRGKDDTLLKIVQEMSAEVRNISQDLMPPVLERFGLADALEELCSRYREQTEATIDLNIDQSETIPIEGDDQINLYRLIQELIQVSLFQYNANYMLIEMRWNDQGLWVNIEDNGVRKHRYGDSDVVMHPWKGIEHRVQFLKGEFKRSSHNQGNEYHIHIPKQTP